MLGPALLRSFLRKANGEQRKKIRQNKRDAAPKLLEGKKLKLGAAEMSDENHPQQKKMEISQLRRKMQSEHRVFVVYLRKDREQSRRNSRLRVCADCAHFAET